MFSLCFVYCVHTSIDVSCLAFLCPLFLPHSGIGWSVILMENIEYN